MIDNRDNTTQQSNAGKRIVRVDWVSGFVLANPDIKKSLTPIPSTKLPFLLDTRTIPWHSSLSGGGFQGLLANPELQTTFSPGFESAPRAHTCGASRSLGISAALFAEAEAFLRSSLPTRLPRAQSKGHPPLATDFSNRPIPKLESTPTDRKQTPRPRSNRPNSRNSPRETDP